MQWFIAQTVGAKMHRDENLGAKILKGMKGLFGGHVIFAKLGAVIGADGQKGDFRVQFFSDLTKSRKVARIACVIDRATPQIEDVAAIPAVMVGHFARAPMFCRNKSNGGSRKAKAFPPTHFVHFFKAETVDKIAHAGGNDDRLIGGDLAKTAAMQVIEMGMGDEHEVDRGKVVVGEPCMAQAAHNEEPVGPVWVD